MCVFLWTKRENWGGGIFLWGQYPSFVWTYCLPSPTSLSVPVVPIFLPFIFYILPFTCNSLSSVRLHVPTNCLPSSKLQHPQYLRRVAQGTKICKILCWLLQSCSNLEVHRRAGTSKFGPNKQWPGRWLVSEGVWPFWFQPPFSPQSGLHQFAQLHPPSASKQSKAWIDTRDCELTPYLAAPPQNMRRDPKIGTNLTWKPESEAKCLLRAQSYILVWSTSRS